MVTAQLPACTVSQGGTSGPAAVGGRLSLATQRAELDIGHTWCTPPRLCPTHLMLPRNQGGRSAGAELCILSDLSQVGVLDTRQALELLCPVP